MLSLLNEMIGAPEGGIKRECANGNEGQKGRMLSAAAVLPASHRLKLEKTYFVKGKQEQASQTQLFPPRAHLASVLMMDGSCAIIPWGDEAGRLPTGRFRHVWLLAGFAEVPLPGKQRHPSSGSPPKCVSPSKIDTTAV